MRTINLNKSPETRMQGCLFFELDRCIVRFCRMNEANTISFIKIKCHENK